MSAIHAWRDARQWYDRLCRVHEPGDADSIETARRNRVGALPILREALAPDLDDIVRAVAAHEPIDAEGVAALVRGGEDLTITLMPSRLLTLSQEPYDLLDRRAYATSVGGYAYEYWLSPFGRLVMGASEAPPSLAEAGQDGNPFARFGMPWWCYEVLRRTSRPVHVSEIMREIAASQGRLVDVSHVRHALYANLQAFRLLGRGRFQLGDVGGRP